MGCSSVSQNKAAYLAETNIGRKAQMMLVMAQKKERKQGCFSNVKYWKKAVKLYDTYNQCLAVHLFREMNGASLQAMIGVCSNARAVVGHKQALVARIIRKKRKYRPKYVMCPGAISPAQWNWWVRMCTSAGPIEYYLQNMGLLPYMTVLEERIAVATANKSAIAVTSTNNITGPTVNVTGPTTNTNVNPVISATSG
jgi:hypothetical protein